MSACRSPFRLAAIAALMLAPVTAQAQFQGRSAEDVVQVSLIEGWRDAWGQGDFPVYFVQLPGIGEPKNKT